ncbi:MAG: 3-phosphoshikimate 1-carboxyvinyltransferase [Phycisphaeraceae bacterium]|nr:MAG: 3-phosphoshikimate 1-carboxyvinyltransferase [Phycisphaeraceae bacterium]
MLDLVEILTRPLGEMPDPLAIPTCRRGVGDAPPRANVRPPGSKSLTNRLLLLAALADGDSVVRHPLLAADDAERMLAAIGHLGAGVDRNGDLVRVRGVGGEWKTPSGGATVNLHNAGTATRFLAAAALCSPEPVTIDGNERMRQRPIGELADLLGTLGAGVEFLGTPGCPPVRITRPRGGPTTDVVRVPTTRSSQFISALLLVAPFLPRGLTLLLEGDVTSASYVRMTVGLLERLGATVRTSEGMRVVRVLPGLEPFDIEVEPDASGATYFWAAGALLPGASVGVRGLSEAALQGDSGFPSLLARMGAGVSRHDDVLAVSGPPQLSPVLADMADMPDAAMTLAACAAFARGTSILRGVRTLRDKECDRIAALESELGKLGVVVEANVHGDPDVLTVTPPEGGVDCSPDAGPVEFETFDDHRMAMSLALIGLRRPGVSIRDPGCVAKTYPSYFADLATLY